MRPLGLRPDPPAAALRRARVAAGVLAATLAAPVGWAQAPCPPDRTRDGCEPDEVDKQGCCSFIRELEPPAPKVVPAQVGEVRGATGCAEGLEVIAGRCCWPGQSWSGEACVGTPSCPDGFLPGEAGCFRRPDCPTGYVLTPERDACVCGAPGFRVEHGDCVTGGLGLMPLPGGWFTMGCVEGRDRDCFADARLNRRVLLSPFWMMKAEVTQAQYAERMGTNPSENEGCPTCPVENVSWFDAVRFANAASEAEGLQPVYTLDDTRVTWDRAADGYRLPTEAEWEYAARGGRQDLYAGSPELDAVAWFDANSLGQSRPVCGKRVNGFGLCDMSGNVSEWTWDWYRDAIEGETIDPAGPSRGAYRVVRGGSFNDEPRWQRVADRSWIAPSFHKGDRGFRLARVAAPDNQR